MKEPKFIRQIRARLLHGAIVPDFIEGVNQACNEMARHYADTPMLNPAQVGYKRIQPIHERHQREMQELANLLAKERLEHKHLLEWRRKIGEIDEQSGQPFSKLVEKLRNQLNQVKQQLANTQAAVGLGIALPKKQVSARFLEMQSENLRLHTLVRELKKQLNDPDETKP